MVYPSFSPRSLTQQHSGTKPFRVEYSHAATDPNAVPRPRLWSQSSHPAQLEKQPQTTPTSRERKAVAHLGTLEGKRLVAGTLDDRDRNDFFEFKLTEPTNLTLSLKQFRGDADFRLYQKKQDGSRSLMGRSVKTRSTEKLALSNLARGTYYIRVYSTEGTDTQYRLMAIADTAGDRVATAHQLGKLGNTQSYKEYIGNSDPADYYAFKIPKASYVGLAIDQIQGDVAIELAQDRNRDGYLVRDEIIGRSTSEFATSITLDKPLTAGTYYIRVTSALPIGTNYTLNVFAGSIDLPTDNAGNSLAKARDLGTLKDTQTLQDFIGSFDKDDFYRFNLDTLSTLNVSLAGLSADADLLLAQDINNNGKIDFDIGEILDYPFQAGTLPETIDTGLKAGTYYIRIFQYSGDTPYTLTLSSKPLILPDRYNPNTGYGLVDAAAAVAKATGSASFPNAPNLGGLDWGLDMIRAPEVWQQGYSGKDVVVAVVDTGIDVNHVDLNANIWSNTKEIAGNGIDDDRNGYIDDAKGWNFVDSNNLVKDGNGHGTHVAGTIAAENNGFGATGVAYNAKLMPVKVLDDSGFGSEESVSQGIRYAVDNGADVVNLSLGGSYSLTIVEAIQYAVERGVVVVMASGNEYSKTPGYPARIADQWGIAVGAVDRRRKVADFSNRAGYKILDYVNAPGVDVYSTAPDNTYRFLSGTSMATPHVAGVAALLLSANPNLTPAQVDAIITETTNIRAITT